MVRKYLTYLWEGIKALGGLFMVLISSEMFVLLFIAWLNFYYLHEAVHGWGKDSFPFSVDAALALVLTVLCVIQIRKLWVRRTR